MPTIDERVAYLEGRVEEHSRGFGELRELVFQLDQKLDRRLDALEAKVDRSIGTVNERISALDQKLDAKVDALDQKLDGKVDALDQKISRQFLWLLGVQITVLVAVIAALIGS